MCPSSGCWFRFERGSFWSCSKLILKESIVNPLRKQIKQASKEDPLKNFGTPPSKNCFGTHLSWNLCNKCLLAFFLFFRNNDEPGPMWQLGRIFHARKQFCCQLFSLFGSLFMIPFVSWCSFFFSMLVHNFFSCCNFGLQKRGK